MPTENAGPDSHVALVIIPTYNEAAVIVPLLDTVLSLPTAFDVLVVDDNSPDGTGAIVASKIDSQQLQGRVHLLSRPCKQGLGAAYLHAFSWFLQRNYSFAFQMDADFSHDPKDLERLRLCMRDYDVALGTRYISGGGCQGWSIWRRALSQGANAYARYVTRLSFRDLTGGFKCYNREALEALSKVPIRSNGYAFQIETTVALARAGFRICEVPIIFHERRAGQSKLSKGVVWEAFWTVLRCQAYGSDAMHPK